MRNVMIDLETWGLYSGCAIRSIGAVQFDPFAKGSTGQEFYVNVDRKSCEEVGLHVLPATEKWWSEQSQKARDALDTSPTPLKQALIMFASYWLKIGGQYPWSQGANYDQPIIEEAMRRCDVKVPWKFWDSRCTRTAYGLAGFNPNSMKNVGTAHHALHDCHHQVRLVQHAVGLMKINN